MDKVSIIINFCTDILNIPISLFGYSITMWQIFIFGGLVYIVVRLFFGIMK